jgi:hypothetical protein
MMMARGSPRTAPRDLITDAGIDDGEVDSRVSGHGWIRLAPPSPAQRHGKIFPEAAQQHDVSSRPR